MARRIFSWSLISPVLQQSVQPAGARNSPGEATSADFVTIFPSEMNVAAAGLNAKDLAKVLVYLSAHRLVFVPATVNTALVKIVEPAVALHLFSWKV